MTKLGIRFWDEEMQYQLFPANKQPDFNDYLNVNWEELVQENDSEQGFNFAWSLRSILWPELVGKNRLEIRFTHDGTVGTGYGPLIILDKTQGLRDLPTNSLKSIDYDLILECDSFSDSDMFMGDYFDGMGFLGIQSLQVEFVSYEDIDSNIGHVDDDELLEVFYENTFSADFRITDKHLHATRWAEIGPDKQSQILNGLISYSSAQLKEYEEYVQEVTDLLAAILIHDDTHEKVRQQLLSKLDALKLGGLAAALLS